MFPFRWSRQGKTGSALFQNMKTLCYYPSVASVYSFFQAICHYNIIYLHLLFLHLSSQSSCLAVIFLTYFPRKSTLGASFWGFLIGCFALFVCLFVYPGNQTWAVAVPLYNAITSGLRMQNNYSSFPLSLNIPVECAAIAMLLPVCSTPPAQLCWARGNSLKEFIIMTCLAC